MSFKLGIPISWGRRKTEFKPVKLRIEIDVLHPAHAEGLLYIYIYIYIYIECSAWSEGFFILSLPSHKFVSASYRVGDSEFDHL